MSEPTSNQRRAIEATGNVLVEAGAGAGKTRTLVERCLARVLDEGDPISLDEILMVTFTEAAAAEMRQRIRNELETRFSREPDHARLAEQGALLQTAHISTLHSFCLHLVRDHFHELGIDPQISVLDDSESRLLAHDTLEQVLRAHYAGTTSNAAAVQQLIVVQGRGWDWPIRERVLRLHQYTQTLAEPETWFNRQREQFQAPTPSRWLEWLLGSLNQWRDHWIQVLHQGAVENETACECVHALQSLSRSVTREEAAAVLHRILEAEANVSNGRKTLLRDQLKELFEEARFLDSVTTVNGNRDPLAEDWNWVRSEMVTLLELTREFSAAFGRAKREQGAVDFHDLEQFALQLLWDGKAKRVTDIAREWRRKFRLVFVDEYQDINEAQDKILEAISRDGPESNRFLVGDVKQSIYRFRLANPRIFQGYSREWARGSSWHQSIPLTENFRSHESILNFINPLFETLMRPEMGGVTYDEKARLRFGDSTQRTPLSVAADPAPRVEVNLLLTERERIADTDDNEQPREGLNIADLSNADKEARLVGLRLRRLKEEQFLVWDDDLQSKRPIEWNDIALLLRAPSGKAESFAKEFARLGIPLEVTRSGFFEALEVSDLLSLLTLLDNPLQDAPALAVLRSPLVGLSIDELARIRLVARKVRFWTALQRFHRTQASDPSWGRVDTFLEQFRRWRSLSRQASLTRQLEVVIDETHYLEWVSAQPRGASRKGNVLQLLALARKFDQRQGRSLHRFLRFIEAQRETAAVEPAPTEVQNAVRLMSIHQSKGLEFPVVVTADLGKPFNLSELKEAIILDEEFGLCPQVKAPQSGQPFPSLPYWLAKRRQRAEALGEELRLLYVALTRAKDALILTGTCSAKTALEKWPQRAGAPSTPHGLLKARTYLDWLGPCLTRQFPRWVESGRGENNLCRWQIYRAADLAEADLLKPERSAAAHSEIDAKDLERLKGRIEWSYPYEFAVHQPAKTSVTSLRRRLADESESESQPAPFLKERHVLPGKVEGELTAVEIGLAHHRFLQFAAIEAMADEMSLKREVQRLLEASLLSEAQAKVLELPALSSLWRSDVGRRIRANASSVQRELSFTLRFTRDDVAALSLPLLEDIPKGEFVVVQGVVDLAVILAQEIWILDFKTDRIDPQHLAEKTSQYAGQLKLYGLALSRIHRRPVTERWLHWLTTGKTVAI